MTDETTGVPTKYDLPPMRLKDWVYGLASMTAITAITCGLWYGVAMALKWVVSFF